MSTTDNGWPASPTLATRPFVIDGVEFPAGIADNDDVELVLRFVLQKVADTVEAPHDGWCWGFGFRPNRNDPSSLSRHSGGIAVDLNAPTNPNGVPTARTWTAAQINAIHAALDDLDEACGEPVGSRVVRWGGDYEGVPDSMHFEANRTPAELRACAARLRTYLEAHMPLTDVDVEMVVTALLDTKLTLNDGTEVTVKQALRRAAQTPVLIGTVQTALTGSLDLTSTAIKSKVEGSRKSVIAKIDSLTLAQGQA